MKMSVDDGAASDIRVAELARKYEIECFFYWPVEWVSLALDNGYTPLSIDEAYEIVENFEIGSHTITHRHLTQIPLEEAKWEIWESKIRLMKMFDQRIDKFCPPRGYTSPALTEFTLDHYKFQRLTKGPGLVHVHPNSGANDNIPWREKANAERYEKLLDIELWMHSWELDRFGLWDELEGYIRENMHS